MQFWAPQFKMEVKVLDLEKGKKGGERAKRHVLWGAAQDTGFV